MHDKLLIFSKLIQHWKIFNIDYSAIIKSNKTMTHLYLLDPPIKIKDFLSGKNLMHKSFDHNFLQKMFINANIIS